MTKSVISLLVSKIISVILKGLKFCQNCVNAGFKFTG